LSQKKRKGQLWWYTPVIPATSEAEKGALAKLAQNLKNKLKQQQKET
jgi:hypothetical protein